MSTIVLFKHILANPDEIPENHGIAFSKTGSITKDSTVLIFDFDDLDNDEDVPQKAVAIDLESVITKSEIEDIIYNAKLQKHIVSSDDLLEAFIFYVENDAFIQYDQIS